MTGLEARPVGGSRWGENHMARGLSSSPMYI